MPRKFDGCLPKEGDPVIKSPSGQRAAKWALYGLTWTSWLFALLSVVNCRFMKIGSDSIDYVDRSDYGLFRSGYYSDDDLLGCVSYANPRDLDGGFRAARAFGVLLLICMTVALILINSMVLFQSNQSASRMFLFVCIILFSCSFVFNLLTFTAYSQEICSLSGFKCSPGAGGVLAIFNILFLIGLIVLCVIQPAPKGPVFVVNKELESLTPSEPAQESVKNDTPEETHRTEDEEGQVEIVVEETEDEIKTTKTVTNPDGSQTITTTIEEKVKNDDKEPVEYSEISL